MNKNYFNHFVDILYYLPRKVIFKDKATFIKVLENEALKFKFHKLLPETDMKKSVNKFLKELSQSLKITEDRFFIIEQLDAFKVLSSTSVMLDPSLIQKKKKEIAKIIIAQCEGYTDASSVKPVKDSEKIIKVAKKYQSIDDEVYSYLMEYAEFWKSKEKKNG